MYLKLVSNIIFEIVLSTSTKDTARFFRIMKRCHCLEGKGDKKMHRDFLFYNLKQLPFFNCWKSSEMFCVQGFFFFCCLLIESMLALMRLIVINSRKYLYRDSCLGLQINVLWSRTKIFFVEVERKYVYKKDCRNLQISIYNI